ncbi:ImpA family type VI secretion system protein [Xenophilus aerolatus]|nr:type VI secretion system ImpA family N-terminal domain-containing protein [Xenophilus aerolatus]
MTRVATPDQPATAARAPFAAAEWLQPLSAQQPCGASLEYDPEYAVLLSRMLPRGDAQYGNFVGTPEAPNWAEIERDCRRLLLRTRDINLVIWLARARTRLGQAGGLAQVLGMLAALLQAWPEAVHPQLVVEGELDPAVRANALAALADPDGLLGDVRDVVVAPHTALRLAVRDVERAFASPRPAEAPSPESVAQQLAALREAAGDDAQAPVHQLAQAAREAHAIERWCREHLNDDAPTLQPLLRVLDLFLPPPAPAPATGVADWAGTARLSATAAVAHPLLPFAGAPLPGSSAPASRDDVLLTLRAARQWFEAHEPSSPVAVLLKQAERMVGKRFSQVADAIPLDLLHKWESADDDGSRTGGHS